MKQRSEKDIASLTALPEYAQILSESTNKNDPQAISGKRQLDYERSHLQIQRSREKRNDSMMAVRKSLAAVDDFYRTCCQDAVVPHSESDWKRFLTKPG